MAQDVFPVTEDPTDEELSLQTQRSTDAAFRTNVGKYLQSDLWKHRQRQMRREKLAQEQRKLERGSSGVDVRSATQWGGLEKGGYGIPEGALRFGEHAGSTVRRAGEFIQRQAGEIQPSPWSFRPATEEDPGLVNLALDYWGGKVAGAGRGVEESLRKRADIATAKTEKVRKSWDDLNLRPGLGAQLTGQFIETAVHSAPSMVGGFAVSRLAAPILGFAYNMTKDARKAKHIVDRFAYGIIPLSRATGVSSAEILKQSLAHNTNLRNAVDLLRHTQGNAIKMAEAMGLTAAAGTGGAQALGAAYTEAYKDLLEQGLSPEDAKELAYIPAALQGASTLLWVLAFGKTGVEATAALSMPKAMITSRLKTVWKHFKWEGTEELFDEMTGTIMGKLTTNPDMTLEEAAMHGITAWAFGGILGGMIGGGMELGLTRDTPEAAQERQRQEREAAQAGTEPDPRNVDIPLGQTQEAAEANRTTQSQQTQREQQMQIDSNAIAERALQLFAELQDRHSRGLVTDEQLVTARNNLQAMGVKLPGTETDPVSAEVEAEAAAVEASIPPSPHTTAPAMPTPQEVQRYRDLMTGAFDPAATDEQRQQRWGEAEALKNQYGGHDLTKIGNEIPVAPPVPSTATELAETIQDQENVNAAANNVVQQHDSDAAATALVEGATQAINASPIVTPQDFLGKSVNELDKIARDANFPGGLSGLAISIGAHMHPSQGELFNEIKRKYEELKQASEAGEFPAGVDIDQYVNDLQKVSFLGELVRAAEGSDTQLDGVPGYNPPFKSPPATPARETVTPDSGVFSRNTALAIADSLIKGGVETRGIVKQVAEALGVPQSWVKKVKANIKKNLAPYPDLKTGAEAAYGLIERGAEDSRLGVAEQVKVKPGQEPFIAGEKRNKVVVQQDVDEITKTINQLKQQIKQLDLLAKGVIQGDHPPQSYLTKRKSLQESLTEARKDLTLYNREMKDLDRAIAREVKKIEAGPEPELVTQKEVDDTLAVFVDKPELRAVHLKSKYGWSLKRAYAVLSKMVNDGLVARPPKITGAFTLTGKSATPPSAALGAQTFPTYILGPWRTLSDAESAFEAGKLSWKDLTVDEQHYIRNRAARTIEEAVSTEPATEQPPTQQQEDLEKAKLAEQAIVELTPDTEVVVDPDLPVETGLDEVQRKVRAMRDEARKEMLRQFGTEMDWFGPFSPRKLGVTASWVSAELANGVVSFARLAEKAWKTFGKWIIPYLKPAYQQARQRYFDPGKMDTDEVIDQILKDASYIVLDRDPTSEDITVEPNEQNLRASLPPLPDKFFHTQGIHGNPAVERPLAQFFWVKLHALAKKIANPFAEGMRLEPWIEDIVGVPEIPADQLGDYTLRFGAGRIQRRDPGSVGTVTAPRLVGLWEIEGMKKKTMSLKDYTPSGQERDFGPRRARRLFDDVLNEFKLFYDANRGEYTKTGRDNAIIDASRANIRGLTLKQWLEWRTDEMDKFALERFNASSQSLALAVGRQIIKTEEDVTEVCQEYRRTLQRRFEAEKAKNLVVVQRNNEKLAVLKTAVEVATGDGLVSDSLIKDSSYQPNFPTAVNFASLNKEGQHVRIEKAKEPIKKAERKIAPFMSLRSMLIEQELIIHGENAWAFFRTQPLNKAELAYLVSMIEQLFPKDRPGTPGQIAEITGEMRKEAMDKAIAAGYVPSPMEKPRTPTLYGAPQGLPSGTRLYRRPTKLNSGVITVAVEEKNPALLNLTHGDLTVMELANPEEAATRDHVIITYNGSYSSVYVFPDIYTTQEKIEVFARLALKPDDDFIPLPQYLATMRRWAGVVKSDLNLIYPMIEAMKPTNLSPEQVDALLEAIDELQATDATKMAIANLAWDSAHPEGKDVFKRDPQGNVLEKDYTRTQPTFFSMLQNLRRFAVISDTYIRDGVPYQRVRLPMISSDVEVPVMMADSRDTVYARYASMLTDMISMALASQIVHQKMGVRTARLLRTKVIQKEQTEEPLPTPGAKVRVTYKGSKVEGLITEVETRKITRTTGVGTPAVDRRRVAIEGRRRMALVVQEPVQLREIEEEVPVFTVRVPDGNNLRLITFFADQMELIPVVRKREIRETLVIDPRNKGRAEPEIFEGEPVKSKLFLGIPFRNFWSGSQELQYRPGIKKKLKERYAIEDLWSILESLGVTRDMLPKGLRRATRYKQEIKASAEDVRLALETRTDRRQRISTGKILSGLAEQIILKIDEIYSEIAKIDIARRRVQASVDRVYLKAKPLPVSRDPQSEIGKLEKKIRERQARPIPQEPMWRRDGHTWSGVVTDEMVPPPHPIKFMRWRVLLNGTFKNTTWQPEDGIQKKLTKAPLGEIIVRVDQTGQQEGLSGDTKSVSGTKVNAWASVVGEKVQIQVWHDGEFLTLYEIDLRTLPDTAFQEFTHIVPSSVTGGAPQEVRGYYLAPEVIANSTVNANGTGIWWPTKKTQKKGAKKFLSIDDYKRFFSEKINLTFDSTAQRVVKGNVTVPNDSAEIEPVGGQGILADPDIEIPSDQGFEGSIGWLIKKLNSSGMVGKGLANELRSNRHRVDVDEDWQSFTARAVDELVPNWRDAPDQHAVAETMEAIELAVEMYRQQRFGHGMASVQASAPSVADVDPALLNIEFKGKQQIRDAIANPRNGMSERVRTLALAFVDMMPEVIFRHLTFKLAPSRNDGVDARVIYGGSFSHAFRLATVIAGNPNSESVLEEIAHSFAEFLPDELANEVEAHRMSDIQDLLKSEGITDSAKEFLRLLFENGGSMTSEQFVAYRRIDWLDLYPLINTDEYFAHNFTDAVKRGVPKDGVSKALNWAFGWFKQFVNTVRAWAGHIGIQRDRFFDDLLNRFAKGDFVVSVNGGYLHEVNRNSDLGNAVALTAAKVRRIAKYEGAQDPTQYGLALMGPHMSMWNLMRNIEGQMAAEGDELSNLARRATPLANNDELITSINELFAVPPVEYDAAVSMLQSQDIRKQAEVGAMAGLRHVEQRRFRTKFLAKKWVDKIISEPFLKMVQQANQMRSSLMTKDAVSASIRGQLEAAVATAIEVIEARKGTSTELNMAQRELNWYRNMLQYTVGAGELMQKMADALAQTEVGSAFLIGSVTLTPEDVRMQYLSTNPPATDLQVDPDVQELAAWMLAREANLRYWMAAASFEADEALLAGLPGFSARVAAAIANKNHKAIRDMFKLVTSRAGTEAKMAFVLSNRNREIRNWLNRANSYAQAADFNERLWNDPGFKAYWKSRAAAVSEYRVPITDNDITGPRDGENVRVPMPMTNEDVRITISSNFDEMSVEQLKATKSRNEIEEWLTNHPDSIDAPFYKEWLHYLESFINGSMTNDYAKIHRFGLRSGDRYLEKLLNLMDNILRTKGNLITNLVLAPRRAWNNSIIMMDAWSTKWHRAITDSVFDAARSHIDDDVDVHNKPTAARDWFDKVGREMFGLMNTGHDFKAGETLPVSGIKVTQADMDAITMQVRAIDEAMEIDATKGMTAYIPARMVQDLFVPGASYLRKTTKTSKWMLPRRFSHEALMFVRRYFDKGITPKNIQQKRDMIDARFNELIGSFLYDRHSDYTNDSPVSAFYPTLLEMIRDGRVTNMQQLESALDGWYINQLAGMALTGQITLLGNEPSGAQHFFNEFDALITSIHRRAIGDDTGKVADFVGGTKIEQENAFTLGRAVRIAPYYFYNYGVKSDEDIIGVKLNGSSFFTQRIVQGWVEVQKITESRIAAIEEEILLMARREGLSHGEAQEKWSKKNKHLLRQGKETATLEDLIDIKDAIPHLLSTLTQVYTQAGRHSKKDIQKINQVVGTTIGSVLLSALTTARNWIQGAFAFNGQRMNRITNSYFYWYPMAAFEMSKQLLAASAFGIPAMLMQLPSVHLVKSGKELMKMAADLSSRNATRAAAIFSEKARKKLKLTKPMWGEHGLMAITELLADFTQNWAASMFKLAKHYKEVRDNGYDQPVNLRAELTSLSRSPGTYGRTIGTGKSDWGTIAMGVIAIWEYWVQVGRTVMPRLGDVSANLAVFNLSMKAIDHLESHLRKRFERIRSTLGWDVVQLGKRITPADVVPTWWGESRDMTAVGLLLQWFGFAGLDLRIAVNDYWTRLGAEPDKAKRNNIRFLTHEQATGLALSGIEELNQPSPSNRPARFKAGTASRTMGALWGWRFNMLSHQQQMFGGASGYGVPVLNLKSGELKNIDYVWRARINWAVHSIMSLLVAGSLGQAGYEALARIIARFLMNDEQRSTRQVWERRNLKEAGEQLLADASTIIPIVDILAHSAFNDQPSRRSQGMDPWVVWNQARNVVNYGALALNTGDPRHGLDNVFKSTIPATKMIINHMPAYSGRVKAMNVQRLLIRFGDREMLRETGSFTGPGGGSLATPLTPYVQRMINEAFNENYVELTRLFNEGVQVAIDTRGISEEDARRRLRDLYAARNPYTRAFKSLPTEAERQDTLSRMSEAERAEVIAGEELFRRGAIQIGAPANFTKEQSGRRAGSGGTATMPAYRQMRTDRHLMRQNRLTPQADRLR